MKPERDFSWLLASSLHEMKNSLALLRQELDECLPVLQEREPERAAVLSYEAARLSHAMVQLLGLYKLDHAYSLQLEEIYLPEFFQGLQAEHAPLMRQRGVELQLECPEDLLWFFDERLVASALNTLINNAIRYTRDCIRITARVEGGRLVLEVADNGDGYPEFLLQRGDAPEAPVDSGMGSTGLGLFFAGRVAAMHVNQGQVGCTRLFNGPPLGGGVFQLCLP